MDLWNLGFELYVTANREQLVRKIREDVAKLIRNPWETENNSTWSISTDAYRDSVDGRYLEFLYKLLAGNCVYHRDDPEKRLITIVNGIIEDDLENFEEYVWDMNDYSGQPRIVDFIQPIDIYHIGTINITRVND